MQRKKNKKGHAAHREIARRGFSAEVVTLMDLAHVRARNDGIETIEFSHVLTAMLYKADEDESIAQNFCLLGTVPSKVVSSVEKLCKSYVPYKPSGREFSPGMELVLEAAETRASTEDRPADVRDILYALLNCLDGKDESGNRILFVLLEIDHSTDLEILYAKA